MLKPISILSSLLRHYFDYISQDDNATAKVNAALDARYVCTNNLETSFTNTEDSISPNDLMSFQWQIGCGIVTFSCFSFFFYMGFLSKTFTIHRTAGEGVGYLFNSSLHEYLDISRAVAAVGSPLRIARSRATGNLWLPSAIR